MIHPSTIHRSTAHLIDLVEAIIIFTPRHITGIDAHRLEKPQICSKACLEVMIVSDPINIRLECNGRGLLGSMGYNLLVNLAKLWYFTNLDFPEMYKGDFPYWTTIWGEVVWGRYNLTR